MTTRTIIAEPRPHHDADGALLGVFVGDCYHPIADLLRGADARDVAVGRATLAAARAEAAYMAHIAATGCDDLATAQALRAAWADANRARRAAVEAAMREEASQ